MKHIAIIYGREHHSWDRYDESTVTTMLGTSVTEWTEVSDEDYQLLVSHSQRTGHYMVVTRESLDDEQQMIARSVKEQIAYVKRQEQKRAAEEADRARKEAERKAKNAATLKARKLKQLQKLQKELGQTEST